jgi:glutaconate CoA-transferase, subunit A
MQPKIRSLDAAISLIPTGGRVALGGNTLHRGPGAAVHEIVRQGKRGLDLIKTAGAYDIDLLCAAGVAASVSAGYVGYESVLGMAPSYRRTVQAGQVRASEHACYTVIAGLRAAIQGVPFMPVAGLQGSDLLAARDFRLVTDPYSGEEVVAIPAIVPDVAIIHVHEADEFGNAAIHGSTFEDLLMIQAARHVILTAERIVQPSYFAGPERMANVSSLYVGSVVEAPRGASPFGMYGEYEPDITAMKRLVEAGGDPERTSALLADLFLAPVTT